MFIVWIAGVGILVYYLFRSKESGDVLFTGSKSPEDQLKERFIRGEIDESAYLRMKETIK